MGAFFLVRRTNAPDFEQRCDTLRAEIAAQGFGAPRRFEAGGCVVYLYGKLLADFPNAAVLGAEEFCLSVGTFFYRRRIGSEALATFHTHFVADAVPWDDIMGQFCVIVAKDGAIHLVGDRMGLFKIYRNADLSVVSSSFLAVAATCPNRTIEPQSVYEYVFIGATFGMRTVIEEVVLVDPDTIVSIDAGSPRVTALAPIPHEARDGSFEEVVEINRRALHDYFGSLANGFGDRIATALSGGHDSRLMLANLRACGVAPYVYVYGADDSDDVRVARRIAEGEGFALHHTDKFAGPPIAPDAVEAVIDLNFRFLDGCPYSGIIDDGMDIRTKCERAAQGRLVVNGMGGEFFREPDFPEGRYRVREIVWAFYCPFDPSVTTDRFCEAVYCEALEQKIRATLQTATETVSRADAEWLMPLFYARYWSGPTISVNNRLGPAVLPFCDLHIAGEAIRVAPRWKIFCAFNAALMRAADLRLAIYPSATGTDFNGLPSPAEMVRELRDFLAPMEAFRFAKRPRSPRPYYLEAAYVSRVVNLEFPYLRRFFRIDRVVDGFQYNRICTLEYLFARYGATGA